MLFDLNTEKKLSDQRFVFGNPDISLPADLTNTLSQQLPQPITFTLGRSTGKLQMELFVWADLSCLLL